MSHCRWRVHDLGMLSSLWEQRTWHLRNSARQDVRWRLAGSVFLVGTLLGTSCAAFLLAQRLRSPGRRERGAEWRWGVETVLFLLLSTGWTLWCCRNVPDHSANKTKNPKQTTTPQKPNTKTPAQLFPELHNKCLENKNHLCRANSSRMGKSGPCAGTGEAAHQAQSTKPLHGVWAALSTHPCSWVTLGMRWGLPAGLQLLPRAHLRARGEVEHAPLRGSAWSELRSSLAAQPGS